MLLGRKQRTRPRRRAGTRSAFTLEMPKLRLLALTAALGLFAAPHAARGEDPKSEAERLLGSGAAEPYELTVPGTEVHTGGAMIAVNAPLEVTRAVITDYGHYAEFMPQFDKSRIVAKTGAS